MSGRDDEAVFRAWEAGDMNGATTRTLERFGPEILGWLVGILRDPDEAGDVFSTFAEQLWTTFGDFGWRCSVRTWSYAIARRAALMHARTSGRRARHQVPLSAVSDVSAVAERVRTTTLEYLQTEKKSAIAQLRDNLPPEDRMLLVLRVDRELAWEDLARIFLDGQEPAPDELKRESARLRKRFQLVKKRLFDLGREAGLVQGAAAGDKKS